MKLARFTHKGSTRIGKVVGDRVVDLSVVPGVGTSMRQVLTDLASLRPALQAVSDAGVPLAEVTLEAPVNDPSKYLAIGMNYQANAEENLKIAMEWFPIEEEAWQKSRASQKLRK